MPSVLQDKKYKVAVTVQNRSGLLQPVGTGTMTITNQITNANPTTLAGLGDVVLTHTPPYDSSTIVYNGTNSKFEVKIATIDGGSF